MVTKALFYAPGIPACEAAVELHALCLARPACSGWNSSPDMEPSSGLRPDTERVLLSECTVSAKPRRHGAAHVGFLELPGPAAAPTTPAAANLGNLCYPF